MKISQEAREAAQNLWQDMQDMGLVSALPLACGSGDFLLHAMQCLINSTLEKASGVALSRANHAQRLIEDGDVTDARVAFMMCAELIEKEIRQIIEE